MGAVSEPSLYGKCTHQFFLSFSCSTPLIRGIHRGVVRAQGESSILSFSCSTPLIRDIHRGVVHSTKGVNNSFFLSHVQLHYSEAIDINLDHRFGFPIKNSGSAQLSRYGSLIPNSGLPIKNPDPHLHYLCTATCSSSL